MRITSNMLINKMMYSLNSNLSRMSKIQTQLATGKKISVPSDDPLIASRSLKFRTDISEIEQYIQNSEDGISWTEVTDNTLSSMGDVVQRARELAVQSSSSNYSSSERKNMKEEVQQLYNQVIKLANTSYAGRYVFSGYKTDKPLILENAGTFNYTDLPVVTDGANFRLRHENIGAMVDVKGEVGGPPGVATVFTIVAGPPAVGEVQVDTTTGQLTFNAADVGAVISNVTASYSVNRASGDYNPDAYSYSDITQTAPMEGEYLKYEVGIGDRIEVNVIGPELFGAVLGAGNAGENVLNFSSFINSLNSDDTSGIKQAIADMDKFLNTILEQRAIVGARTNRLELTKNRLGEEYTNISELMSINEDADMAEVIMKLKNEENVYRASLDVGARIIQPSLLDFLR